MALNEKTNHTITKTGDTFNHTRDRPTKTTPHLTNRKSSKRELYIRVLIFSLMNDRSRVFPLFWEKYLLFHPRTNS